MKKRTIIILIIALAILIIFSILLYFFVFKKAPSVTTKEIQLNSEDRNKLKLTDEERKVGVTEAEKEKKLIDAKKKQLALQQTAAEEKKLKIISILKNKTISPTLSSDLSKLLYFDPAKSDFFVSELDGSKASPITASSLQLVYDINWSKQKEKAIINVSENKGQTGYYMLFDIKTQTKKNLDTHYKAPTFSPDGDKLAYLYKDETTSNISTANLDGSNFTVIAPFDDEKLNINWNLESQLIYYKQPSSQINNTVFSANTKGQDFRPLVNENGLINNLSNDGHKFIFSGSADPNANNTNLQVYNIDSAKITDLQLMTFANKCVWLPDNENVICGIPENKSSCLIFPDAYLNYNYITVDSFYKINTSTAQSSLLAKADLFDKDFDVFNPFMLGEKIMYFTRRQDGQLYSLILP